MKSKKLELFNTLSFWSLIATFFLSIFFFVPYISVPLESSKGFLLFVGVALSTFFWLVARMIDGRFVIPREPIIFFAFLIPIIFLLSSFLSDAKQLSFFGTAFEPTTFTAMLTFFLVLFLSSVYFQTPKRFNYFYKSLLIGAGILAIGEIIPLFLNINGLLPGFFSGVSSGNLLGSWNDFGLFFGGITVLSLITLELSPMKLVSRILLSILVIVSLFFLMLVNSQFIWLLTGVFTLIIFVYTVSVNRSMEENGVVAKTKPLPVLSFVVILVCLLFLIGNNAIGGIISNYFGVSNINVSPSVSGTFHVACSVLWHDPLLGSGPNTFSVDWSMWKPVSVIPSLFWNADFNSSFGLIPTFFVTTGILGILGWFAFLGIFLLRGYQSIKIALQNAFSNFMIISSLVLAVYFWVAVCLSVTGTISLMLAFASTGVFIGVLVSKKVLPLYDRSFLRDPRTSFFCILALVVLMIASLCMIYAHSEKFASNIYFSQAQVADATLNSYVKAETNLLKAVSLSKSDLYYRALSQVYLGEIQVLLADKSLSDDTLKSNIQTLVTRAETTANNAIAQNPKQYTNWTNLGDVYTAFAGMGVANSYENAVAAYAKALTYAPKNPNILLSRAGLEIVHKDNSAAREFVAQALQMKPNYVDAFFTLAQIELSENNTSGAIHQVEKAASIAPNDHTVFFRLGLLRYNALLYSDAVNAFETAVILNPTYWNARYFLGLSYEKVGRITDAKTQFTILKQYLPDNKEVQSALDNLGANTKPTPVVDPKKLPLPEKKQ